MASNSRYANGHRRRELRKRVLAEESICHLCGSPVDKTLRRGDDGKPHPMSPELDEIVPVSRGGSPLDRANVRLSHRICNELKGNNMPTVPDEPVGPLFPLSRSW